jgi:DNA-binding PadR family transcriptional regulator
MWQPLPVGTPAATLSLTELVVLGVIAEEPRHGFAVARELTPDSTLGQVWTVRRPLVYRAVDRLHDLGLVSPARTEPGDQGPNRTVFVATRSGRARLRRWLAEPVAHPRDARTELLAKFLLLARVGAPLTPLAEAQLARFLPVAAGLQRAVDASAGAERLVALARLGAVQSTNQLLRAVIDAG